MAMVQAGTFIMTEGEEYPAHVPGILDDKFIEVQNKARDDWKIASFYLEPLDGLGIKGEDLRANWLNQAPPKPAFIVPFFMAGLMLLIACFNFTNTSLAISSKRLKEIGIRKVVGAFKTQLIAQFLTESFMVTFIAMVLAIGIRLRNLKSRKRYIAALNLCSVAWMAHLAKKRSRQNVN